MYNIKINNLIIGYACNEEIIRDILIRYYQAKGKSVKKELKDLQLLDTEFSLLDDKITVKSE